jgi:Cohesin domain
MVATLLVVTGFLATALPASGQIIGNTLELSTVSAPAGDVAIVTLSLANEDAIGGIQTDILFDASVVSFNEADGVDRGAGMAIDAQVVEAGRLRLVMYFSDADSLVSDFGSVAGLVFTMQGETDDMSTLTFEDIILSDPYGGVLEGTGVAGSLTVLEPTSPPTLTIAALKNPGNTRIIMIMVTVTGGSGDSPVVSVGTSTVTMMPLGGGVYEGQHYASDSQSSITFTARDTNSHGTGSAQVILALP